MHPPSFRGCVQNPTLELRVPSARCRVAILSIEGNKPELVSLTRIGGKSEGPTGNKLVPLFARYRATAPSAKPECGKRRNHARPSSRSCSRDVRLDSPLDGGIRPRATTTAQPPEQIERFHSISLRPNRKAFRSDSRFKEPAGRGQRRKRR